MLLFSSRSGLDLEFCNHLLLISTPGDYLKFLNHYYHIYFQVSAIILENTFTSILDMAAIMFPFLKWFIGSNGSKGPKILNYFVRSPWSTIDIIDKVSIPITGIFHIASSLIYFLFF